MSSLWRWAAVANRSSMARGPQREARSALTRSTTTSAAVGALSPEGAGAGAVGVGGAVVVGGAVRAVARRGCCGGGGCRRWGGGSRRRGSSGVVRGVGRGGRSRRGRRGGRGGGRPLQLSFGD